MDEAHRHAVTVVLPAEVKQAFIDHAKKLCTNPSQLIRNYILSCIKPKE